jgi:hypothetical protein
MTEQRFSTTIGADAPPSLFIVAPPDVITALSEKKRPPARQVE